jgi:hypothetical protein
MSTHPPIPDRACRRPCPSRHSLQPNLVSPRKSYDLLEEFQCLRKQPFRHIRAIFYIRILLISSGRGFRDGVLPLSAAAMILIHSKRAAEHGPKHAPASAAPSSAESPQAAGTTSKSRTKAKARTAITATMKRVRRRQNKTPRKPEQVPARCCAARCAAGRCLRHNHREAADRRGRQLRDRRCGSPGLTPGSDSEGPTAVSWPAESKTPPPA